MGAHESRLTHSDITEDAQSLYRRSYLGRRRSSMVIKDSEVSAYLRQHSTFARQWFLEYAEKEWIDTWRSTRKEKYNQPHRFGNNLPPVASSSGRDDNFLAPLRRTPISRSRGSITSDMFARHVEQQGSTLTSLIHPQLDSRFPIKLDSLSEKDLYMELIRDVSKELNVDSLCYKILLNVNLLTKSDRGSLFLARGKPGNRYLVSKLFDVTLDSTLEQSVHSPEAAIRVPFGVGIAGHVAQSKEIVNIRDCYQDPRFNKEVDKMTGYETHSMLCMPILNYENEVIGVAQIINKHGVTHEFTGEDERVFTDYLNFCGIGLTNAQLFEKSVEEYKRNLMLLRLARNIFRNQQDMEQLIATIMKESVSLLECERCMVYLIDDMTSKKKDSQQSAGFSSIDSNSASNPEKIPYDRIYVSKVFDITNNSKNETLENSQEDVSNDVDPSKVPIEIMKLAKQVASEGTILNIEDFEQEINETVNFCDGRHLYNLLCVPIRDSDRRVIGVAQLMNKTNQQPFGDVDENTFETFAIFVGIGIHNCKMYENVKRLMMKQTVAFEVLSYHVTAPKEEVEHLLNEPIPNVGELQLDTWEFDDRGLTEVDTLKSCVRMFTETGALDKFQVPNEVLCRWLCSVKKNYRNVTYHNWRHAFNVTQTMFTLLFKSGVDNYMSDLETFGLLVACLCHDLDHRGTNNSFQSKIESPLAKLYTTSTMENHHFDQCVMILNAEGNNIFASLSHNMYRKVIMIIRGAILSTDLAVYFKKRATFKEFIDAGGSDVLFWQEEQRKSLLRGMLMTACDVAAITKPWELQFEVAHLVAAEFFEQGDIEKEKLKEQPIPLMDREKKDEIPKMQVGFIDAICVPLYEILFHFKTDTKAMYDGCLANRDNWQRLADGFQIITRDSNSSKADNDSNMTSSEKCDSSNQSPRTLQNNLTLDVKKNVTFRESDSIIESRVTSCSSIQSQENKSKFCQIF